MNWYGADVGKQGFNSDNGVKSSVALEENQKDIILTDITMPGRDCVWDYRILF